MRIELSRSSTPSSGNGPAAHEGGDGGEDGALPVTGAIAINVIPVNDAPIVDVNLGQTQPEGSTDIITTVRFSHWNEKSTKCSRQ